jgi:hypothetical protein
MRTSVRKVAFIVSLAVLLLFAASASQGAGHGGSVDLVELPATRLLVRFA